MRKQWKILVCFLLVSLLVFAFTACTTSNIEEKEIDSFEKDGIKYIVINKIDEDGATVLEEYATVVGYTDKNNHNLFIPSTINDIPVKNIASLAFFESNIKYIELAEGIKRIDNFAFGYAKNLVTVNLPKSIEYIGDYAFVNCLALKRINIDAQEKPIIGDVAVKYFNKKQKKYLVNPDLKIYVPSKEAYKPTDVHDKWAEYQDFLYEEA